MQFIKQYKKGTDNFGTYMLSIALILASVVIGNLILAIWIGFDAQNLEINDSNKSYILVLKLIPALAVIPAILFSVKFLHKRPVRSVFTAREKFDWKRLFTAFVIWGICMTVLTVISFDGTDLIWNFQPVLFVILVIVSVLLLPLQVMMEEILFRGYLFQAFGALFKHGGVAVLVTSVFFGMFHIGNPEVTHLGYQVMAFYILSGLFLTLLTHLDDGLELALGYHIVNNVFIALVVTSPYQALQTDALYLDNTPPSFGWHQWITLGVAQPLMLFIFAKIYRWKGIKSKLLARIV